MDQTLEHPYPRIRAIVNSNLDNLGSHLLNGAGIFATFAPEIWGPNVGQYSIHGAYGDVFHVTNTPNKAAKIDSGDPQNQQFFPLSEIVILCWVGLVPQPEILCHGQTVKPWVFLLCVEFLSTLCKLSNTYQAKIFCRLLIPRVAHRCGDWGIRLMPEG